MKNFIIIICVAFVTIASLEAGYCSYNYDVMRPKRHTQKIRSMYKHDDKKQHQDERYRTEHFVISKNNNINIMSSRESTSSVTLALIGISLLQQSGNTTF